MTYTALSPSVRPLRCALLALVTLACSGSQTVETTFEVAGSNGLGAAGTSTGAAGASGTGLSDQGGGAGATGDMGADTTGGAGTAGSAGTAAVLACRADGDCPAVQNACAANACISGKCQLSLLPFGTPVQSVAPSVCHASVCDGQGQVVERLDPRNVPVGTPCRTGVCDALGNASSEPAVAGTPCSVASGQVCDGAGQCVACLSATDCASGLSCIGHVCVGSQCTDGVRDGNETDVDCGGACSPCAVGLLCAIDQDCSSDACEPVSKLCLSPNCIDEQLDGDETDVDCGGSCSPCVPSLKCRVSSDCTTQKCDPTLLTCLGNECADGRQDGTESDVDCGGPNICPRCRAGGHCTNRGDCNLGMSCNSAGTCSNP